jgi:hypothetical protein
LSPFILTDVTPNSFSVVWIASQASTCTLRVFNEQKQELSVDVVSENAQQFPAEDIGIMKVRVNSLSPDNLYHFQTVTTSKADTSSTVYPEDPVMVRTEKKSRPVQNKVLIQEIYFDDDSHADGSLMLVSVETASHPISGWVGAVTNPPSPWAVVDLNNVYSFFTHENLQINGGEAINVDVIAGLRGFAHYPVQVLLANEGSTFVEAGPPLTLGEVRGDIDGNNQLNLADVVMGLQLLAGFSPPNLTLVDMSMLIRAFHNDVDGDFRIGMPEIIYILQKLAQLR